MKIPGNWPIFYFRPIQNTLSDVATPYINPRTVSKITYFTRFLGSVWTPMLIWTSDPWIHNLFGNWWFLTNNKNITRFGPLGSKRTPENGSRVKRATLYTVRLWRNANSKWLPVSETKIIPCDQVFLLHPLLSGVATSDRQCAKASVFQNSW